MLSSHFSLRAPTTVGRKKKNSTFINFFLFTNQHHWPVIKIRKLRSDSEIIPSQFLVSGGHWSPWWQGSFANHSGLPLFWVSSAFFSKVKWELDATLKGRLNICMRWGCKDLLTYQRLIYIFSLSIVSFFFLVLCLYIFCAFRWYLWFEIYHNVEPHLFKH